VTSTDKVKLGHKMTLLYRRAVEGLPLVGPTGLLRITSRVSIIDKVKWAMRQLPGMKVGWEREGSTAKY
jgi:hypothetical protein